MVAKTQAGMNNFTHPDSYRGDSYRGDSYRGDSYRGHLTTKKSRHFINMKRFLLILILAALFAAESTAQRFEGGLLAGFNGTQVEGDRYKGYHKPGLLGGVFVQTDLAPAVFAAMELKYSQKGARSRPKIVRDSDGQPVVITDPSDPGMQKYIMRLGYAELPVYAGFRTSETVSVIGGVSFGYLLHSGEYDDYGKFPQESEQAFNSLDVQPFVGFQFDFLDNLKLDLRLAYSVLPIRGKPLESYYWISSQFNNVISMGIYYRLDR